MVIKKLNFFILNYRLRQQFFNLINLKVQTKINFKQKQLYTTLCIQDFRVNDLAMSFN